MSVELASELWSEIKRYINDMDRQEAAETYINVLIDNDIDADDIRTAFRGETEIKKALQTYLDDEEEDEEEDYEEDDTW
jgi:hypothetical protein